MKTRVYGNENMGLWKCRCGNTSLWECRFENMGLLKCRYENTSLMGFGCETWVYESVGIEQEQLYENLGMKMLLCGKMWI